MKDKLKEVLNKFSIPALLLIISCNANMNTNEKNKSLNEQKLQNISEVIKNSLQIESDFQKELDSNTNQNTPPILEIEKIEPEKQESSLKSESESLIPPELLKEENITKSEEEIAKIQEKLLLIGASLDEPAEGELDSNMQKFLNPATIEFKISSTSDEKATLNPIEKEINANYKEEIFDQKEENNTLKATEKNTPQNQFQNQNTHLGKDENFITKEYAEKVRKSLDEALNAIKSLEKSQDLLDFEIEIENLATANSSIANIINTENMEKIKNRLLKELEKSELIFEDTKDPLGTSSIKQIIDTANKWQEKENLSQINWDLGSRFHPNLKLYNESVAWEYKVLAEKFTKVKNEYKNTKEQLEQLKIQSQLTTNNISKIIDATIEFTNQVRNLILLVENNH
ncbi:hypothetical protein QIA30_00475 (plasmid) [Borreliella turdi]|uniref:hypothetical protein n=1 Tax=Borreliella turdi TaxID=57863 RepID=UPI002649516A|nr:hypothetical protein [Borreliella turdi]WKC78496.1 hypothetical protein QIA30_00475 [Borreliella turdi]